MIRSKKYTLGVGVALGAGIGAALGSATHMAAWLPIGIGIGLAIAIDAANRQSICAPPERSLPEGNKR